MSSQGRSSGPSTAPQQQETPQPEKTSQQKTSPQPKTPQAQENQTPTPPQPKKTSQQQTPSQQKTPQAPENQTPTPPQPVASTLLPTGHANISNHSPPPLPGTVPSTFEMLSQMLASAIIEYLSPNPPPNPPLVPENHTEESLFDDVYPFPGFPSGESDGYNISYFSGIPRTPYPPHIPRKADFLEKCITPATEDDRFNDGRCAFCWADYDKAHPAVKIEPCGHVYGEACLRQLVNRENKCPKCKVKLFREDWAID
ncbi:hypothetical protein P171DRAFT_491458 [Karstenula rhodostoma CBS 690.94]|uniref:RING-type domain-containing protein n=1 Tax=Karstenula rhodostoma CBS 690.94 TaxID=1392251 RepID=A0A9P4U5L9_9PLEO|nr:hypothetical protein P171DRAFT_491458 [Karstenula rhodostoma CBS 690.94]